MNSEVVTIQQTAKKYKLMQTIGMLLIVAGVAGMFFLALYSGAAVVLGILLYAAGRWLAWWHHG